jgi:SAM-dependent methyltransferase
MRTDDGQPTVRDLPQPFGFYRHILKGDHLHFGHWPKDDPQMPMEQAQEEMFERLLSFFPPPPAKVLDVGCGLGYSAYLLSTKGYEVTGVAPSPELVAYAREKYAGSGARFMALGFFDDHPVFAEGLYDVLFFQESMQYLSPLSRVMERARRLLKEKGTLIMGDEVCYDRRIKELTAVHLSADYTVALSEAGFKIAEREKVGGEVSPTCAFIVRQFTENFDALAASGGKDGLEQLRHYLDGWKNQQQWYADGRMGYELIVAKKDSYFIRPYAAADERTILPMFNQLFFSNRSMEHWYWKFRDNPYGPSKIALAFSAAVPLAVHYAGYPVPFYSHDDAVAEFVSLHIGDTMTSPAVRNIGLGKTGLLARTAEYYYAKFCEGAVPFIYGFNTGHIRKLGMKYLGYTYISPVPYRVRNLKVSPLKPLPVLRRLLSDFAVGEITSVNAEWRELFRRVSPSYRFLIRRDDAYIKWRYLDCPDKVHRLFSIRRRGVLVGWSVFVRRENTLMWGDALFDNRYPESVTHLLHAVINRHFPGVETIEGWFSRHPDWWSALLDEAAFAAVPEPNDLTPCFVIFGDRSIKNGLENRLYYTWGDSDLF